MHAADARVITASDYTVLIEGVPSQLSAAELQEWCSHYGSGEGGRLLPLQWCDCSMPAVCLCNSSVHLCCFLCACAAAPPPCRPDFDCAAAALPLLVFVLTVHTHQCRPAALQWWAPSMYRMWATACGWRSACRCCWSGAFGRAGLALKRGRARDDRVQCSRHVHLVDSPLYQAAPAPLSCLHRPAHPPSLNPRPATRCSRAEADAWLASDACSASAVWFNLWALGATSQQRMQRQLDNAARKLRCYERQELRPTGGCSCVVG